MCICHRPLSRPEWPLLRTAAINLTNAVLVVGGGCNHHAPLLATHKVGGVMGPYRMSKWQSQHRGHARSPMSGCEPFFHHHCLLSFHATSLLHLASYSHTPRCGIVPVDVHRALSRRLASRTTLHHAYLRASTIHGLNLARVDPPSTCTGGCPCPGGLPQQESPKCHDNRQVHLASVPGNRAGNR